MPAKFLFRNISTNGSRAVGAPKFRMFSVPPSGFKESTRVMIADVAPSEAEYSPRSVLPSARPAFTAEFKPYGIGMAI